MKSTIKTLNDLDAHSIPHAAMQRVNHAVNILLAVENLIKQKGRYNTEIAYNALVIAVEQEP